MGTNSICFCLHTHTLSAQILKTGFQIIFNCKEADTGSKQPSAFSTHILGHNPLISPSLGTRQEAAPLICTHTHTHSSLLLPSPFPLSRSIQSFTTCNNGQQSTNHLPVLVKPTLCRPCKQRCKTRTRTPRNWRRRLINWRKLARSEV